MPLTSGVRFGAYEIIAPIGAGGMGQVWRAIDTTLDRQVAVKVLPDEFATHPDRVMRFEREAKTLAALNHPHIASIYGFEKSANALVMELVEGEDLSRRIARGAIPIDEALPIASQIAEALEAAHELGIVHRDLKPANIKIRHDGTVKVLDFGLAKALDPREQAATPSLADSPTLTSPAMTMGGVILGTAAYMSPEQAAGRVVDKRTDLWAFGVVLFEMLTGKQLFTGESVSHVLASVLKSDPEWSRLPADTPPAIRRLLRRCLEKDRKRRMADANDVRLDIEEAMTRGSDTGPSATHSFGPPRRPTWMFAALAASTALIAAMATPTVRYLLQEAPPPPAETRTDIVTPAGNVASFALSPDGRQVVYLSSSDGAPRLWLRSLAATPSQPLAGTEGAEYPFWSPDSRSIGFFANGELKKLDLGAVAPLTLARAPSGRGASWTSAGVILFAPNTTGPLMRVTVAGGEPAAITAPTPVQGGHRWPVALPDGRRFIFFSRGELHLGSLEQIAAIRLTSSDGSGAYLPPAPGGAANESGWLVWPRGGNLMACRLDVIRGALIGEPVMIATNIAVSSTLLTALSASRTGQLLYRARGATRSQLTWVDRTGKSLGTIGPQGDQIQFPVLAPDGRRVAVTRTVQNNTDVWLLDGDRASRLTFDAALDSIPIWSPDGSRIVFRSLRDGRSNLYEKLASGVGAETAIVVSDQEKIPTSWSPNGQFLLFYSIDSQSGDDLWVARMSGDRRDNAENAANRKASLFLKTPFRELAAVFSPDSRWVAYMSNESGRMEVYVRRFQDPESPEAARAAGQWQISSEGGVYPRWRHDGKEIYFHNLGGEMMAASVVLNSATIEAGTPVMLFQPRVFADGVPDQAYDVARDGRFLINTILDAGVAPITVLMNWNPRTPAQ